MNADGLTRTEALAYWQDQVDELKAENERLQAVVEEDAKREVRFKTHIRELIDRNEALREAGEGLYVHTMRVPKGEAARARWREVAGEKP